MNDASTTTGDFAPTANWTNLRLRASVLKRLRAFFDERGFLEVETPLLSADTVVDRHLDPVRVTLPDDLREPEVGRTMWLQTSPEFAMKRMLAAGAEAIYQVTRAFRAGEVGALHNPEFTMVEWYRSGDSMHDGISLLGTLAEGLLGRGVTRRISYRDVFMQYAGVDPHTVDEATLCSAAERLHVSAPNIEPGDRDSWLDVLLVSAVEPHLVEPTIVFDYPASQSALARVRDEAPPVAERFELYVDGIELANGYHELLDAAELRRRNRSVNQQRAADGKTRLPETSRLLAAMDAGLPACTGVALGFDRLAMVAAGAKNIAEVIAFPIDRA